MIVEPFVLAILKNEALISMKNKGKNWIDLIFWGVRGSIATPRKENIVFGGNTSCFQVKSSFFNDLLIFDCGSGIVSLGNELSNEEITRKGRIFVTHTHWDHIQGIPFFKPFYKPGNSFSLHMFPQMEKSCRDIVKMVMAPVFFPVNVDAFQAEIDYITETGIPSEFNDAYQIESLHSAHPGNTVMYKVRIGDKSIVYCPDNEYEIASEEQKQLMRNFMRGADVLIHDSQETRESYPSKKGWGHSAWETVIELAAELDVKNLFLTHHSPDSHDEILTARNNALEPYRKHFNHVQFAIEAETFRMEF